MATSLDRPIIVASLEAGGDAALPASVAAAVRERGGMPAGTMVVELDARAVSDMLLNKKGAVPPLPRLRAKLREGGCAARPLVLGAFSALTVRRGKIPLVSAARRLGKRFGDQDARVGWLDLPALRYAMALHGQVDALALTGFGQLTGFRRVKVCVAYVNWAGTIIESWRPLLGRFGGDGKIGRRLRKCRPLYLEFAGWRKLPDDVATREQLPARAQEFLEFLEGERGLQRPIEIVEL